MNISQILDRIEYPSGEFEHRVVQLAILHSARMVPPLIDILTDCAERDTWFFKKTGYIGHLYALHILTELREPETHIPLLQLCTLPPALVEVMFGDAFLETEMERALAATADGDLSGPVRLIEDPGVHCDVRRAAINALVRMAVLGDAEREDVIDCVGELLLQLKREPSMVWEDLVGAARDLCADELRKEVRHIWQDGLIAGEWKEIAASFRRDWKLNQLGLHICYELREPPDAREWWTPDPRLLPSAFCGPADWFDDEFETEEADNSQALEEEEEI